MGRSRKRKTRSKNYNIDLAEVGKVVDAVSKRPLTEGEQKLLKTCHEILTELLVREPRNNEKSEDILKDLQAAADAVGAEENPEKKPPRKGGNGRTPREGYPAAIDRHLEHPDLKPGDLCPCGCGYRLYASPRSSPFRHFVGQVPIQVTFYYRQQLKSAGCDNVYTAPLPEGVGPSHYDATAVSIFILMRYGLGLPMYRQAAMLTYLGVPIAASTQFEVVAERFETFKPIGQELVRQAAQGEVAYLDDTGMTILKQTRINPERTGTFTTGIISTREAIQIALYFTGENHSGENMKRVLEHRSPDLPALIQMSDALSRNFSELEADEVIECSCLTHGRRNFVDIVKAFPEDCRHVLEAIGKVYAVDKQARDGGLDPPQRLALHQEQSKPVMDNLKIWMDEQFKQKKVEPNSPLGSAIKYMNNHWDKLTVFLRVAGAPLDNNTVERALKKVVLHRKNSLFYRTAKGAAVGDLYMSIIQTCQLNKVDPFDYLTKVQRNAPAVAANPSQWLPWTYKETLAGLAGVAASSVSAE
jgi:transposase